MKAKRSMKISKGKAMKSKKSAIKLKAPLPPGMSPLTPPQSMLPKMPERDESGAQDMMDLHRMAGQMNQMQMGNDDPEEMD